MMCESIYIVVLGNMEKYKWYIFYRNYHDTGCIMVAIGIKATTIKALIHLYLQFSLIHNASVCFVDMVEKSFYSITDDQMFKWYFNSL